MLFVEPAFLFGFVPAALGLFGIIGRRRGPAAALTLLLLASLIFYSGFGQRYFLLLLASIAINFCVGAYLCATPPSAPGGRRLALVLGQCWNFGALLYFKYLGYFLAGFAMHKSESMVNLAIPVGISFYTFHQAVFLADAYNRKPEVLDYLGQLSSIRDVCRAAARYGAFICFFPQLVIGPIVYLKEFAPSVLRGGFGRFRRLDVEVGLTQIVIGLFKKVVLADQLAPMSSALFEIAAAGTPVHLFGAWSGIGAYYLQLYFDFSGYSDMAIGLARLFGIRLPINFDSPLRASGIRDFYARWHMTLTRVIVRFLFTPLSLWGTRLAVRRRLPALARKLVSSWLPLLLNFVVIGLWHGALPTFLVFGLVHGTWVILESEIAASKRWRSWARGLAPQRLRRYGQAFTFLPLMLSFGLFASPNLHTFGVVLKSLFLFPPEAIPTQLRKINSLYVLAGFAVVWLLPNSTELMSRYHPAILTRVNPSITPGPLALRWRPDMLWCLVLTIMMCLCLLRMTAPAPFLYQGF